MGWVDRSHRKLAHHGSYTGVVFVSPSTVLSVALKHRCSRASATSPIDPRRSLPRAVLVTVAAGATLTASAMLMLGGGPG
jgi:putative transposase